jgi:hypothetical protein
MSRDSYVLPLNLFHGNQMTDLPDHAPNFRGVMEQNGTIQFPETHAGKNPPLRLRSANITSHKCYLDFLLHKLPLYEESRASAVRFPLNANI